MTPGSKDEEPHLATYTRSALNETILAIVPDKKVQSLLENLTYLNYKS